MSYECERKFNSPSASVLAREIATHHISSRKSRVHSAFECSPIRHNEPLEVELGFEDPVQDLAVLARKGLVDTLIGAHH